MTANFRVSGQFAGVFFGDHCWRRRECSAVATLRSVLTGPMTVAVILTSCVACAPISPVATIGSGGGIDCIAHGADRGALALPGCTPEQQAAAVAALAAFDSYATHRQSRRSQTPDRDRRRPEPAVGTGDPQVCSLIPPLTRWSPSPKAWQRAASMLVDPNRRVSADVRADRCDRRTSRRSRRACGTERAVTGRGTCRDGWRSSGFGRLPKRAGSSVTRSFRTTGAMLIWFSCPAARSRNSSARSNASAADASSYSSGSDASVNRCPAIG